MAALCVFRWVGLREGGRGIGINIIKKTPMVQELRKMHSDDALVVN